jgi:hypothetical protein
MNRKAIAGSAINFFDKELQKEAEAFYASMKLLGLILAD